MIKSCFSSRQSKYQKGNVFFFIALGIFLFGALSYAVTRTSGSGTTEILDEENAKISKAQTDAYFADINAGITQLQLDKCDYINFTIPANQGTGDKSCYIFHADGAGVKYLQVQLGIGCDLTALAVGETCNGVQYVGLYSGVRLYVPTFDVGFFTWNNGSTTYTDTGATSTTNGLTNTDILVALNDSNAPYPAANACRNLGEKWYLPAELELNFLFTNRLIIKNINLSSGTPGSYLTSTEKATSDMYVRNFGSGNFGDRAKHGGRTVRCVRRD